MPAHPVTTSTLRDAAGTGELRLLGERGAAGLLRAFALIWIVLACASWLLAPTSNYEFLVAGLRLRPAYAGWLIGPAVLLLVQLGRIKAAIAVLLWAIALIPVASAWHVSGLHNHILVVPPVAVMTAGWLLGWRQAALMAAAVMAGHAGLLALHQGGHPYAPDSATIKDWLVFGFANAMALALGVFTMRSFRRQYSHVLSLSADLERQVRALRLSEARFAEQFRANPLPSAIGDADARILDVNDAWIRTFGIERAEAIGRRTDELGIWADSVPISAILAEIQATGGSQVRPVRMRVASGETRDFVRHLASIDGATGRRYISMLVDQTDRLAAEAAQRALNVELEARVAERTAELSAALQELKATQQELVRAETLASLGNMVAGISHELNTPIGNALTVMTTLHDRSEEVLAQAAAGTLKRGELSSFLNSTSAMSELGARSMRRAAELIGSFKQVAADQVSERRREFDLRQTVADIVASLQPRLLGDTPWRIELDLATDIACDSYPGVLGQVLASLVQNAARHAFVGRDHGTIRIVVRPHDGGDRFELVVSDDGIGMDTATVSHVFAPFFTTTLGKGSSGMGLAVSHRLAASVLGGELSASAAPGAGSRFTLRAPRVAPGRV